MSEEGLLVIPDIPVGTEIGINLLQFQVGEKFKMIGSLPLGLHFLYETIGVGLHQGQFLYLNNSNIVSPKKLFINEPACANIKDFPCVVRCWDKKNECISNSSLLSEDSTLNLYHNIIQGNLNEGIGSYQEHHNWENLTKFITFEVLVKCKCLRADGQSVLLCTDYEDDDNDSDTKRIPTYTATATSKKPVAANDNTVVFTNIKTLTASLTLVLKRSHSYDASAFNMDKSALLSYIIQQQYAGKWELLMGEVQLAFITMYLLYSYEGLQQWHGLIDVITSSEMFLKENLSIVASFSRVLFHQLNTAPTDFFEGLCNDEKLKRSLCNYFTVTSDLKPTAECHQEDYESAVENRKRLISFVQQRFNWFVSDKGSNKLLQHTAIHMKYGKSVQWELSDEDYVLSTEDMPVIVETEHWDDDEGGVGDGVNVADGLMSDVVSSQWSDKWGVIDAALSSVTAGVGAESTVECVDMDTTDVKDSQSVDNPHPQPVASTQGSSLNTLSNGHLIDSQFSWRYPALYEWMMYLNTTTAIPALPVLQSHAVAPQGVDMLMTARHVLDEVVLSKYENVDLSRHVADVKGYVDQLRLEATMYIEYECK